MRMIDSTTTFLDLSVVVDDLRIACRHHEQQSPLDRPRLPQYPLHGSFARPNARSRLHTQQPPADDHVR